jgi:hypothetical protein
MLYRVICNRVAVLDGKKVAIPALLTNSALKLKSLTVVDFLYRATSLFDGIQEVSGSIPLISTKHEALKTLSFRGFLHCP